MNRIFFLLILLSAGMLDAAVSNDVPLEVRYNNSIRRADYQRMETAYRERQKKRHEILVEQNKKVVEQINTPPWLRTETKAAGVSGEIVPVDQPSRAAVSAETAKSPERNHRFLISFVVLILISGVAGWVRHATREVDE